MFSKRGGTGLQPLDALGEEHARHERDWVGALLMEQPNKLPALTAFRFVAAFYVFLFHFHVRVPLTENRWGDNFLQNGAVGMTFFFVLSGFVITYAASKSRFDRVQYLKGRFLRIYPAYAVTVALSFVVFDYGLTGWGAAGNVAANALSIQGWFYWLFPRGINGGTWSLSVEWFFYLTFALFFPAFAKLPTRRIWQILAVSWGATCIPLLVSDAALGLPGYAIYSNPAARFPEFMIGACFAVLFTRGYRMPYPTAAALTMAAVLVIYLSTVFEPWIYMRQNWIASPLTGAILFSIAPLTSRVLSSRLPQWLGQISYSFFLLQFIPLYVLVKNADLAKQHLTIALLLTFFSTLALAALSFRYVEMPFMPKRKTPPDAEGLFSGKMRLGRSG